LNKTIVIVIVCSVSAVLGGMIMLGMYQNYEEQRAVEFTNTVDELVDSSRTLLEKCDEIECRDRILHSFVEDFDRLAEDYGQNPNDMDVKQLKIGKHFSLAKYWVAKHHPIDPKFELPTLFE